MKILNLKGTELLFQPDTLVHRALMICTKCRLNEENEQIKKILLDNGYSKNIVNAQIAKKITQFSNLKQFCSEKFLVYLGSLE